MSRLKDYYNSDVAPALMKKFNYKSPMQIPRLEKVVINCCESDAKDNSKVIDNILGDLAIITGQKGVPTVAKKSVSNFKSRLVIIPTNLRPSVMGTPEIRNFAIKASASANV